MQSATSAPSGTAVCRSRPQAITRRNRSAWLAKFSPPPGKLIKIVATALSNEHVFNHEGGRATKSGQPVRSSGRYTLNPEGQPHSAFISAETVSLVIYRGEPDEIVSMEMVDAQPTLETA
jgi:hypothetical protein